MSLPAYPPGTEALAPAPNQGRVGLAVGGGARASVAGGVGGRGPRDGANFATCVSNAYKKKKNGFFLKDALWGGGGYPPQLGGRGG